MNFVTYYKYWLKCYIYLFTFLYIVPKRMGSLNILARAIDKLYSFFSNEKKLNQYYKSNFSKRTTGPSGVFSRIHFMLSPFSMFNALTISFGIVHLIDSDWGFA